MKEKTQYCGHRIVILSSLVAAFLAVTWASSAYAFDNRMIGTWECTIQKKEGTWKILWVLGGSGLYHSTISGPGYVPDEWGFFESGNGKWGVKARGGRTDVGTYKLVSASEMVLVGQDHQTSVWRRVNDADVYPVGKPWPAIPPPMLAIPPGVPVMWGHIKEDEKPSAANNWGYGDVDPNPDPSVPYVLDDEDGFAPKYPPKPGQAVYSSSYGRAKKIGVGGPNGEIIRTGDEPSELVGGGVMGGLKNLGRQGHKPGWYQHDHQGSGTPWILKMGK